MNETVARVNTKVRVITHYSPIMLKNWIFGIANGQNRIFGLIRNEPYRHHSINHYTTMSLIDSDLTVSYYR